MKYTKEKFNMFVAGFCLMGAIYSFGKGQVYSVFIQLFFAYANFVFGGID